MSGTSTCDCLNRCSFDCTCECADCKRRSQLAAPTNRAGLSELAARVGDYALFFANATRQLSLAPELRILGTRETSDPAIGWLDAWSVAADVLTFYRERLTQEGYLRTATQEASLRELARLVGFKPRPGVAATVYLAYDLEPTAAPLDIPAASKAQTVPRPGEKMQTFETAEALRAQAEWSTMAPRQSRPPNLDLFSALTRASLRIADATLFVRPGEKVLFAYGNNPGEQIIREVGGSKVVIEKGYVELALKPRPGLTLSLAHKLVGLLLQLEKDVANASGDKAKQLQRLLRIAVTYLLGGDANDCAKLISTPSPIVAETAKQWKQLFDSIAHLDSIELLGLKGTEIDSLIDSLSTPPAAQLGSARLLARSATDGLTATGPNRLSLLSQFNPQLRTTLNSGLAGATTGTEASSAPKIYLLRISARLFASLAAAQEAVVDGGKFSFNDWTLDDADKDYLFLDATYEGIGDNSFAVIEVLNNGVGMLDVDRVRSAQSVSRSAYGVSAKVTRLALADLKGSPIENVFNLNSELAKDFVGQLRSMAVFAQSEEVRLFAEEFDEDIAGDSIALDALYAGLDVGRWIIVAGERTDIKDANGNSVLGIRAAELAMIAGLEHSPADKAPGDTPHTTITLARKLAYSYQRATAKIYGNVVLATHGETVSEVLGSGDASTPFASYALKRSPLTFVPAATPAGASSTEMIRVNGQQYARVDTLLDAGEAARVYEDYVDEVGAATVTFGDGRTGARLPTGSENVRATYRVGIGASGNVQSEQISLLASRPLGVRGVVNPAAATGGAERDGADRIRMNAPLAALALGPMARLVSIEDYAAFARRFAAIGHADAVKLADGVIDVVHVTVAGVDDVPLDPKGELIGNLRVAFDRYGDPSLHVVVGVRELVALFLQVRVAILSDADWETVEPLLRKRLLDTFSFDRRELGQPAYLSEAIAVMQSTAGVDSVDVDLFEGISETVLRDSEKLGDAVHGFDTTKPPKAKVPSALARINKLEAPTLDTPRFLPSQLVFLVPGVPSTLVLNPATT